MPETTQPRSAGHLVRELLRERGWTQDVLATVMGVTKSAVSRIVQNKRAVDAPLALQLSEAFQIDAKVLLDAQQAYDLAEARAEIVSDPKRAIRAQLYARLPIAEMIKRRWLDANDARDAESVEASLLKFFGVSSLDQIEILPHASKKTDVGSEVTPAQLAWLYRVRAIAEELIVPRYTPSAVRSAVEKLGELRRTVEDARHAGRILAEAGIRFVVVESLSSAKIDGVCFWLNDMAPVIGVTLRHDRIDNFWFVLRHEIEHVLKGHGRVAAIIDVELEHEPENPETVSDEERIANEAAADFCVPREKMDRFFSKKAPFFMERDVVGFAATMKVHPGLVVGQLHHRMGRFDRLRGHLAKIRHVATSGAAVDGWGDVYPLDEAEERA